MAQKHLINLKRNTKLAFFALVSLNSCQDNHDERQVLSEFIIGNGDSVTYVQEKGIDDSCQLGKLINAKKDSTWTLLYRGKVVGYDNWFRGQLFGEQKRVLENYTKYKFFSIDSEPIFYYELKNCTVKRIEGKPIFIIENKSKIRSNVSYENLCFVPPKNECVEISIIAQLYANNGLKIKEIFNSKNSSFCYKGLDYYKENIKVLDLSKGIYSIKYFVQVYNNQVAIKADTFVMNFEVK